MPVAPDSDTQAPMSEQQNLSATLAGLEIGATGPSTLQVVLETEGGNVAVQLTAEEARWLAAALEHWATESETISVS